ncbi:hypothetical protein BDB00DRAFT_943507 [Zychaea mexicana]|uniref:uncharacterized protein n=1 Tax=Zychaea mexicana TaxID=64656 RepID=UPI0022FF26DB|nr:uncharacterized protein BDB00DRAFT_943507 [Zychaea mexicana]KAI9477095.1 hypothetical protein BDB00DRAFT_943507 [Zychaea mexicana]
MTDFGFQNLRISDHHNTGSDQELPLPPTQQYAAGGGNYDHDYSHQQQQQHHQYQQQQQYAPSPPPGIMVDGEMWQGNDEVYDDDDRPLDAGGMVAGTEGFHSGPPPPPKHHQQTLLQMHEQQQQQEQVPAVPVARPVSYRNQAAVQINSNRPARFIKADPLNNAAAAMALPPDLQNIQRLYEQYQWKVYMEGYLYRKAENKRTSGDETWIRSYVELAGPVLTLWDADTPGDGEVLPHYVNISDATTVELNEHGMVSLKTGGTSRYLFEYVDDNSGQTDRNSELERWVRAIRLSCYEGARIHEIYTKKFIMRNKNVQTGDDDDDDEEEDLLSKAKSKMEGFVQVRFAGANEWQKYWVVVSDRRNEKKLFGKKSVPSHGQLKFYESKKGKHPIMTLVNVTQAYTVYPETPQLIDMVTLLKVDGRITTGEEDQQQQQSQEGGDATAGASAANTTSVLMMTSSTIELVEWLVATFDVFKLYGRPSQLIRDPTNPGALNFGEIIAGDRLFLEVDELNQMNVRENNMAVNRTLMTQMTVNKLKQQVSQRHPGMPGAPSAGGGMGPRTNSMPQIAQANNNNFRQPRQRTVSADPEQPTSNPRGTMMMNNGPQGPARGSMYPPGGHASMMSQQQQRPMQSFQQQQQQQQRASAMPPRSQSGKVIYASDESDEEEDEEDDDSDSDDDSVFNGSSSKMPINAKDSSPTTPLESKLAASTSSFSIPEIKTDSSSLRESVQDTKSSKEKDTASVKRGSVESDDTPAAAAAATKGKQLSKDGDADDDSDESDEEKEQKKIAEVRKVGPRPSLSGSDEDSEQEESEDDDDASSTEQYIPHKPKSRWPKQQQQQQLPQSSSTPELHRASAMPPMQQQPYDMDPHMYNQYEQQYYYYQQQSNNLARGQPVIDEDGPVIPQLGEEFANPNSLLGSVKQEQGPSIRDQTEYAKATGQPLVQLAQKQSAPRAGLVGMISQIEHEKNDKSKNRLVNAERDQMMERERYMMEQRQQAMMNPMMGMNMGMGMMDPRMSMMPPNMMGGGNNPHASMMMMQPMMDPRMSMMPPNMMGGGGNGGNNQHASMMMMPPMMDPRMSMMQGGMMGGGGSSSGGSGANNQHPSMMMPPMMDPRMSMMPPNMMMYNMWNNGYNNQFNNGPAGNQGIMEESDEDDDVPLGAGSHSKSPHRQKN